jgi:hypothetical protein
VCRVQPVEQPKGAPFWSPILLTMSMTVATTGDAGSAILTRFFQKPPSNEKFLSLLGSVFESRWRPELRRRRRRRALI